MEATGARVEVPLSVRVEPSLADLADALEVTGAHRSATRHRLALVLGVVSLGLSAVGLVMRAGPLAVLLPLGYGLLVLPRTRSYALAAIVRAVQPHVLMPYSIVALTARGMRVESALGRSEHDFSAYAARLVARRTFVAVRSDGVLGFFVPQASFGSGAGSVREDGSASDARAAFTEAFLAATASTALAEAASAFGVGAPAVADAPVDAVVVSLTPDEARRGLALLRRSAPGRTVLRVLVLAVFMLAVVASVVLGRLFDAPVPFALAGVAATALLLLRVTRRAHAMRVAALRPFTLHVEGERLRVSAATGTFDGLPSQLAGRSEDDEVLVLHVVPGTGFILPKRQLPAGLLGRLRDEVKERVG